MSSSMDHWEVLCADNRISHYGSGSTGISLVHLIEMRVETIFLGQRFFLLLSLKTLFYLLFHKHDAEIYSPAEQDC